MSNMRAQHRMFSLRFSMRLRKGLPLMSLVLVAALYMVFGGAVASSAGETGAPRWLERVTLPDGIPETSLHRPVTPLSGGSVEVIIETQARSLVQEQAYRRSLALAEMSSEEQKAYVRGLKDSYAELKDRLKRVGAHVGREYQIAFSGLSARVEASKLPEISALPGVKTVHRVKTFSVDLGKSVPFILGGKSNQELGVDGTGVVIAVIDTGIDYTHAALGGSGNPSDYAANNPAIIEPGTFPTAKVIGGIDLVGDFYAPDCPFAGLPPGCTNVPQPDPDPLDIEGHGTHVSAIAAGMAAGSVPQGVAPGAKLLAIKVFGLGSTSEANVVAAIEFALDPNQDGDTSDHVDVINMSLGSPFGSDFEPDTVAANAAAALGVIVVASAGNSGDIPYITGSPASASDAISVAAGNDPGVAIQLLRVSGSSGADGAYESVEATFTPPLAETGMKTGLTEFVGLSCDVGGPGGPNPFAPSSLTGKIPLIQRGACTFVEKVVNAEEAGAAAAVVFNNLPGGGPFAMGGDPIAHIPAVMIGNMAGLTIVGGLLPGTTLSMDPVDTMSIPDQLQDFTSRGPRFVDSALKPDVTAPGGAILSAAAGTGTGAVSFSGTSMSSPHVAGAAALLRQLRPDWSVQEIKSLLMNTATNAVQPDGKPYPLERMGAGRIRVDVAVHTESVVLPASVSFGIEQSSSPGTSEFRSELTVVNKSNMSKTFALSASPLSTTAEGSQVSFNLPPDITVNAQDSQKLDLRVQVNVSGLQPESAFAGLEGFLTLRETTSGLDVLSVPFQIVPGAIRAGSEVASKGAQVELRNNGTLGTQVDIYQFGVSDPDEDLILEPAGSVQQPDDWFDIRHTGAHAFDMPFGRVVQLAVTVHGARSVANPMVTEVFLDVDKNGVPDYVVVAADRGQLVSNTFDGQMVTAIFELGSGAGLLEFLISNEPNASWQVLPFLLEDLNLLGTVFGAPTVDEGNPDINYFVATTDLRSSAFDTSTAARFNTLEPGLDAVPQFLFLPAGERLLATVFGPAQPRALLTLFYNNVSGESQSQVIEVR